MKGKHDEVREDLMRALGPCGAGNAEVQEILIGELGVAASLEARWSRERVLAVQIALLWGIGQCEDPAQAAFVDRLMKSEKNADLVKLAVLVKQRLEVGLSKMTYGHGKAHRAEIHRLLAPFVKDDKIEREYVRDLDRPNPKGG